MATKVYDTVELTLENGDTIEIKPLPIKSLRKFMEVINKMESLEDETELGAMDVFLDACVVCLKGLHPSKYGEMTKDEIEDILNVPTMMKILEVAGGLKTADPNLGAAVLDGLI